jgi:SRSO17 transposase
VAVAAGHRIGPGRWRAEFDALMARFAGRFARVEPRRLAGDAVRGLMSDVAVKNCWTLAEHAGHESPDGLQHLLCKAKWDDDGVRDDLRDYVVDRLGSLDALLVVDLCRYRNYADLVGGGGGEGLGGVGFWPVRFAERSA